MITVKLVLYKKKVFAPQIRLASVRSYMGLNVTFNCHGLHDIIFAMRSVEVLYVENDSELIENNYKLICHKKKLCPTNLLGQY